MRAHVSIGMYERTYACRFDSMEACVCLYLYVCVRVYVCVLLFLHVHFPPIIMDIALVNSLRPKIVLWMNLYLCVYVCPLLSMCVSYAWSFHVRHTHMQLITNSLAQMSSKT